VQKHRFSLSLHGSALLLRCNDFDPARALGDEHDLARELGRRRAPGLLLRGCPGRLTVYEDLLWSYGRLQGAAPEGERDDEEERVAHVQGSSEVG
jgi:hypothetical protein